MRDKISESMYGFNSSINLTYKFVKQKSLSFKGSCFVLISEIPEYEKLSIFIAIPANGIYILLTQNIAFMLNDELKLPKIKHSIFSLNSNVFQEPCKYIANLQKEVKVPTPEP